jgi:hypothetical protein
MILDTNAVSDFADANQGLLNRLQQSAEDIHLPDVAVYGRILPTFRELPKSLSDSDVEHLNESHRANVLNLPFRLVPCIFNL